MLALIAGQGELPKILLAALDKRPKLASLEGFLPNGVEPDIQFRLETLGTLISDLKAEGVTDVCFAGAIARPSVDPALIDTATMPLVPRIAAALQAGDDSALRVVIEIFEEAGLVVRGAAEIAPHLLPLHGVPTKRQPDSQNQKDADRAADICAALGRLDLGQSCVVRNGQALGLEALPGTDHMLKTVSAFSTGTGGLFFKAMKPGQERRIDMPVIGVETVLQCAAAGVDGIVIEAQGVMVLDLDGVIAKANELGMFLWVRE